MYGTKEIVVDVREWCGVNLFFGLIIRVGD